jgi:NADH:ubiquinone oxidoreductase subunit 4 (subunit M)
LVLESLVIFVFIVLDLLSSLVGLPLIGAFVISFLSETSSITIRQVGLFESGLTFIVSLLLWIFFDAKMGY